MIALSPLFLILATAASAVVEPPKLTFNGQIRARATAVWFNTRAPGYTSDFTVADTARSHLIEHTAGLPVPPADCALN